MQVTLSSLPFRCYGATVNVYGGPEPYELIPHEFVDGAAWVAAKIDDAALLEQVRAIVDETRVMPAPPTVAFSKVSAKGGVVPGSWLREEGGRRAALATIGTGEAEHYVVRELLHIAEWRAGEQLAGEFLGRMVQHGSLHARVELLIDALVDFELSDPEEGLQDPLPLVKALLNEPLTPLLRVAVMRSLIAGKEPDLHAKRIGSAVREFEMWIEQLLEAAALGAPWAFYQLGRHYARHLGRTGNRDRARAMFLEAARRGHPDSLHDLSALVENQTLKVLCLNVAYETQQERAVSTADFQFEPV